MVNLKRSISIPETLAQLIQSHSFRAYLYPQIFGMSDTLATKIYDQQSNLFGGINTSQSVIGGILNMVKNFNKGIIQRRSLGQGSFEVQQTIPKSLDYDFNFDRVVFYKPQAKDTISQLIDVDSNGFIKQFVPFMLEEIIKNPDNTIEESTFYYDVWITNDTCNLDLNAEDLLVIRKLQAKGSRLITKNNSLVDYAQALNTVSQLAQDVANSTNSLLTNFKIPTS